MMTISYRIYSLFFFLFLFTGFIDLHGQFKDFQTWWELELEKEINGNLALNGELEQRFRNNSLQYASTMATLGVDYKLFDFLSLAGGARATLRMDPEQNMYTVYRVHMDLTGGYDLSGFDLSLRARLQYGFDELMAFRYFGLNSLVNRNRLKVTHHIFGTRFDWFASVESWHGSTNENQWITYAIRYSAGARYSLNFRSRLSLRYILEDEFNAPNPLQVHVLVMGYSYKL
jgi:hypothetical protein